MEAEVGTKAGEDDIDRDLIRIQEALADRTETASNDTRDLVHSD